MTAAAPSRRFELAPFKDFLDDFRLTFAPHGPARRGVRFRIDGRLRRRRRRRRQRHDLRARHQPDQRSAQPGRIHRRYQALQRPGGQRDVGHDQLRGQHLHRQHQARGRGHVAAHRFLRAVQGQALHRRVVGSRDLAALVDPARRREHGRHRRRQHARARVQRHHRHRHARHLPDRGHGQPVRHRGHAGRAGLGRAVGLSRHLGRHLSAARDR